MTGIELNLVVSLQMILTKCHSSPQCVTCKAADPGSAGLLTRDRPTDLPQLFSGDEHLCQPLQLCSLLLHGVPNAVHLSAKHKEQTQGGFFYATHKDNILHWENTSDQSCIFANE